MNTNTVIILGSSRNNGNTARIVEAVASQYKYDVVNLNDYEFSYYDYERKNREDDFFPLVKNIIGKYKTIIFATPVYWYSMSGIMKVFFDRFSDLVRIEKETGRKLQGKRMGVLSNSGESVLDYDFYIPFKKSAEYLGMEYIGDMHINAEVPEEVNSIEIAFI